MRLRKRGLITMFLLGAVVGAGGMRYARMPLVSEEWRSGVYAGLDAVAEENSYARNAAERVRSRIHECLGSGRKWSSEITDCHP